MTLRFADHQPRPARAELQVLRDQPDRGHREDLVGVADLGPDRRLTADAPMRQSRPIETLALIVAYAPMLVPRQTLRLRMTMRRRVDRDSDPSVAGDPSTGPTAAPPRRRRCRRDRRCRRARARFVPPRPETHFQRAADRRARPSGGTWRCRRRAETRAAPSPGDSFSSSTVATWASVSIMSTPGISGSPGKCP
jgi:hypothetical protein